MTDNAAVAEDIAARRFQVRITSGLMASFGGLVLLAVGLVLWLGLWSTRQNTLELTRTQAAVTLALLRGRIEAELKPAESAVDGFARQLERGDIDVDDYRSLQTAMRGVMTGTGQLMALVFVDTDGRAARMVREDGTLLLALVDVNREPALRQGLAEAAARNGAYWGEIVRPQDANVTLINVRRPVYRDARFAGVAVATVVIDTLSRRLEDVGELLNGVPFVLDAGGRVVAHRALRNGYADSTPERPLPRVDALGDPVLSALMRPSQHMDRGGSLVRETGVKIVRTAAGDDYAVLDDLVVGFGREPWRAGVYFPIDDVNAAFLRMVWAAGAGVGVLLLALLVAWLLARYLSRPVLALAAAAVEVRDLHLGAIRPLTGSVFRELNAAGSAFNSMVIGLRWFEIYVPRQLVHRLMRHGAATNASEQRELTVLFTDLVGFTTLSERLSAAGTADLLNRHFALLAACVEAEGGTIDKFIGDGLMAFWGAPEPQPDHAARAVRAGLAVRQAVAAENERRVAAGEPALGLRIGVHSGPVVVGNIGAPGRINYTIVGDAVNLTARLEQMAKDLPERAGDRGCRILASADTVRAAGAEGEGVGSQPVRGRREPVEVFRL